MDCRDPCAEEIAVLSAITTPQTKAVFISLLSVHFPNLYFSSMIDSGSSHCFLNEYYARSNHFPIFSVPRMRRSLIDGSTPSFITRATLVPVRFPCGTIMQIRFLLTKLDSEFPAVLGLDWLTQHNPLINWANSSVTCPNNSFLLIIIKAIRSHLHSNVLIRLILFYFIFISLIIISEQPTF